VLDAKGIYFWHAFISASESMTSLLPVETVLKLPPSEMHKESIIEKVSRKTSFRKGKNNITATVYSIADLQLATNSFNEDCLISEGGSGSVYRANFSNGKVCFVHRNVNGFLFAHYFFSSLASFNIILF
jgi:hypothetical protein